MMISDNNFLVFCFSNLTAGIVGGSIIIGEIIFVWDVLLIVKSLVFKILFYLFHFYTTRVTKVTLSIVHKQKIKT